MKHTQSPVQPIEDDAYDWRTIARERVKIDEPDPKLDFNCNQFAALMGYKYDRARDLLAEMLKRNEITVRVIRRQNWYRFV